MELKKVVLVEGGTGYQCGSQAFSSVVQLAPVRFLRYEGDVVDELEVEEAVDDLCTVGTVTFVKGETVV
jgi:hypothetical protein